LPETFADGTTIDIGLEKEASRTSEKSIGRRL